MGSKFCWTNFFRKYENSFRVNVFFHLCHRMGIFVWFHIILELKSKLFFMGEGVIFSFSTISIPIYVKHNIQYREGTSGRFELTVGPKQTMGKSVGIDLMYLINWVLIFFFFASLNRLLLKVQCQRVYSIVHWHHLKANVHLIQ